MHKNNKYFELVKNQCVSECKQHTFEEVAKNAFSKFEVVDLFLSMEESDRAYAFILNFLKKRFSKNKFIRIYIPGSGVGGLARIIYGYFSKSYIFQVDCSKEMVVANKKLSANQKNIYIKKADILKVKLRPGSFDCVVAYGVMRYIPENKRSALLNSWIKVLVPGGRLIVGEGRGGEIVNNLNALVARQSKIFLKKVKLFRCSLFYLLCKKYENDRIFKNEVDRITVRGKTFADTLKKIAGFVTDNVYVKEFIK